MDREKFLAALAASPYPRLGRLIALDLAELRHLARHRDGLLIPPLAISARHGCTLKSAYQALKAMTRAGVLRPVPGAPHPHTYRLEADPAKWSTRVNSFSFGAERARGG